MKLFALVLGLLALGGCSLCSLKTCAYPTFGAGAAYQSPGDDGGAAAAAADAAAAAAAEGAATSGESPK